MDDVDIAKLHAAIVAEFQRIDMLDDWVATNVDPTIDDVVSGSMLSVRVTSLLQWMDGHGQQTKVLQALADHPPNDSRRLPALIYRLTHGEIKPSASIVTGIPPVEPYRDWFVAGRPFVNREGLRAALETLDVAATGANSVLVIDGHSRTGKTHGILMAVQCAPQARFNAIDLAIWGAAEIGVGDLAQAIVPAASGLPNVDPTKESAAVPSLLIWLVGKLKGTNQWIIVDHCNRLNLSGAAETLLLKLTDQIAKGFLPGVRLILADVLRSRLPDPLTTDSRYDHAELPDLDAARAWCQTLATHVTGAPLDAATLATHVGKLVVVDPATNKATLAVTDLEQRLRTVLLDIRASAGK
jgi:hypothetical protein